MDAAAITRFGVWGQTSTVLLICSGFESSTTMLVGIQGHLDNADDRSRKKISRKKCWCAHAVLALVTLPEMSVSTAPFETN